MAKKNIRDHWLTYTGKWVTKSQNLLICNLHCIKKKLFRNICSSIYIKVTIENIL